MPKGKQAYISRISLSIPPRPSKSVLVKLKFFKKNVMVESVNKSYVQALRNNIKEIFKIKNTFSKLFLNKVLEIHNVINKLSQKSKAKLNMTTKGSFRKQIIVPGTNNTERVMVQSNTYITNINRLLKDIK